LNSMRFIWRWVGPAALMLILGLALLPPRSTAQAAPTDTITLTAPNNVTISEVDDYATQQLHDPWDMNNLDDLDFPYHFTAYPDLTGGTWKATTTGSGAFVQLQYSNFNGVYSWLGENDGVNHPIATTYYTHLRFRMKASQTGAMVLWWFPVHSQVPVGNSRFIDVTSTNWQIYDVDLAAGGPGSNGTWTAQSLAGLRFDMPNNGTPNNIEIDWVRLTQPASSGVQISWTYSSSGNPTVNLYASADPSANGTDEQLIASVPASTGSYTWTGAGMAPGTYYIHAAMNGARAASGPLVVNPKPIVHIDAPSPLTGEDYAAARLATIWDENNPAQFPVTEHITNAQWTPNYFQATATTNDPTVWWLAYNTAHPIDTSLYRYMSMRLWLQTPSSHPTAVNNAGPRMTWSVPVNLVWQQTEPILALYNRWIPVTYDLPVVPLVGGGTGWTGQVTTLRFDPHEEDDSGSLPDFFRIDKAHLTTQPVSNNGTLIRWTPLQGSGLIDLYWDTDNQGLNGTVIAQNIPLAAGSYGWNTAGLPNGSYWVYVITHDALGASAGEYSLVPVVVSHSSASTIFTDVPTNYFVANEIADIASKGIIGGYLQSDSTLLFQPASSATRGQVSKMIVLAAGWPLLNPGTGTFQDVAPGSTFYQYVETAAAHGVINGYPCGGAGEPCVAPGNRPYYRLGANVTRGQISKMIALSRGWALVNPGTATFNDVPVGSTFFQYVETSVAHAIISGYPCGGPGEPCPGQYFRPGTNVTRAQLAKMLSRALASP
jgi:hypothetical protein